MATREEAMPGRVSDAKSSALKSRLYWIALGAHTSVAELQVALICIAWGIWFLNPAWTTLAETRGSAALYEIIPHDEPWGAAMLLLGLFRVWAVLANNLRAREWASATTCFFWTFLTVMVGRVNMATTAVPVYGSIALFSALMWWRMSVIHSADAD